MTTAEIDARTKALNQQKAALQADLEAAQERNTQSERSKDELRSLAIRDGDATAKRELAKLRQTIAVTQLEAADITDEISKLDAELADLQAHRALSRRVESWEEFLTLAETTVNEAVGIDVLVAEFFASLKPHCEMLAKLNDLLIRSGMEAKRFSMVDFQRFYDVRARTEFAKYFGIKEGRMFKKGSAYEQDYSAIVETRIKHLKMRHDGVPVPENEEPVPKMVIAINE